MPPPALSHKSVEHRFAVCTRGIAYSWGRGQYGVLGHDDKEKDHPIPARIRGLNAKIVVARVACGRWHCIALSGVSGLYCWGRNQMGQLGLGYTSRACAAPTAVELEPGGQCPALIRDIAAGTFTQVESRINRIWWVAPGCFGPLCRS